jgi:UPF0755 protein
LTASTRQRRASRATRRRRGSAAPRAPRKSKRTGRFWRLGFALASIIACAWTALFGWGLLPTSAREVGPRLVGVVGDDRRALVRALSDAGLVDAPFLMLAYSALVQPLAPVAARDHWLGGGRTPRQLLALLGERGGEVGWVALPEGRTSFELAERLERAGICEGRAFLRSLRDPTVLREFGIEAESGEGYLFPESHQLRVDERPERVARRFLREGRRRLSEIERRFPLLDEHRALGLGWREIVILASVVERETARPAERSRIARVFLNRLAAPKGETGGRLESDPTALYGCLALGESAPPTCGAGGLVTPALLKDERNPYSTYRHAGLPPGPIGNPGEAALIAVLRPAEGDELYFVADGEGNHHFSRTFAEHRQSVERLKALRRATSGQALPQ